MISGDIVVLRPAAQNVPPGVALPAGPQGRPGQDGAPGTPGSTGQPGQPGKDGITQDISGKLDKTGDASGVGVVPDGTAAVGKLARTAWDAAVSTAQATATDNLSTFNAETAARNATGATYRFNPGRLTFSAPLVQPSGVSAAGAGRGHLAFYQTNGRRNGTFLLIAGQAGQASYTLQGTRYGAVTLRDLSIYDTSNAAIKAVLDMGRNMHCGLSNVELACLNTPAGYGLFCDSQQTPIGADTLYATFAGLKISNVRTGIGLFDGSNALSFFGGSIFGTRYTLEIGGTYTDPTGIAFSGTSFESTFDPANTDISYLADTSALHGYPGAGPVYVAKLMKIGRCNSVSFRGCYYELGGIPSTYNDGTNGTLPIVAVISVEAGAKGVDLGRLNNTYLLDAGQGTRAILTADQRYDGTSPAAMHVVKGAAQTIAAYNSSWDAILFDGTPVLRDDSRISYAADGTIKFKEAGNYQLSAKAYFEAVNGGVSQARIRANLPGLRMLNGDVLGTVTPTGSPLAVSVSALLVGMTAGQTLKIEVFQGSDNPQTVQGYPAQTFCTLVKV